MKNKLLLLFVFSYTAALAQKSPESITFAVADVKKTTTLLKEVSYKNAIEHRINRKIEDYPIAKTTDKIVPVGFNAFVAAVHYAYAEHRPLVISPDMIWLLITQGFSIHVNENAEKLRKELVNHEGKASIVVGTDSSFTKGVNNDWAEVFGRISDSIKSKTKANIYDLVVADFSTTTAIHKTVYEVVLMDATQKYFQLRADTGCGIPEITLEGSVADWQWIRDNVVLFKRYEGLEKWIDNLLPVLDEFVAAAKGNPNKVFWDCIYKKVDYYNAQHLSGWVIKFFPYYQVWKYTDTYVYSQYIANPYLEGEDYHFCTLGVGDFPSGISKCPFIWRMYPKDHEINVGIKDYEMEICGGFMGLRQNPDTKAVRAEISWAVRDSKSNWLHSNDLDNGGPMGIAPYDYWEAQPVKKPDVLPVFCPDSAKTYAQGMDYLQKHLQRQIQIAKQTNDTLSGKVLVSFVVTWSGSIARVKVDSAANAAADEAAKGIVLALPRWKPGTRINKDTILELEDGPVKLKVSYPLSVTLDFGEYMPLSTSNN